ncbi:MAG: CvpA family protein [Anaerolineae bacterium]|jgi:hypothetical protein|nr:CvpA family protein [Anaerolineae bacterium]
MIELIVLVWLLVGFFGYVGALRGWTKELISMAGIVLALFGLFQFDTLIRRTLLAAVAPDVRFYIQTVLFLLVVFFAYQTRALVGGDATRARSGSDGRDPLQTKVLGILAGAINGYLIAGTIWYLMDINRTPAGLYPLDPFVIAPPAATASASAIPNLPLYLLTSNGASADLLSLAVIVLFIIVLIMI